ncbi:putative potassium transporter 2, partial [Bienertia sinuspersici]
MVLSGGVLTPALSVLSSFQGLRAHNKGLNHKNRAALVTNDYYSGTVVTIVCIVLVGLFALQHRGLLAYTGSEAMFVDLGYFSTASLRVSFSCLVYPCLILQYMGQAAFLSKNNSSVASPFYSSIPDPIFWPMFVLAILAAATASQAVISMTFSIVKQCHALGCFPRVKAGQTSRWLKGQVYIPEINWILMVLSVAVTIGFRDTALIGNAYGGWASLVLAVLFVFIMYVWHYGSRRKYLLETNNGILWAELGPNLFGMYRCIIRYGYKDIDKYVDDFEDNLVMSIAEFIRMEAEGARSSEGSMAVVRTSDKFGTRLVASDISISQTDEGSKSIHRRSSSQLGKSSAVHSLHSSYELEESPKFSQRRTRYKLPGDEYLDDELKEELIELLEAKEAGVAYVVGHSYIKARRNSSKLKRFMINYAYSFLRKNCRSSAVDLHIPHISLIE